jgi:hypothetical protein
MRYALEETWAFRAQVVGMGYAAAETDAWDLGRQTQRSLVYLVIVSGRRLLRNWEFEMDRGTSC